MQGGSVEGRPRAVDTPAPARSTRLASFDVELTPASPFVASGDADEYRCFVLDPAIHDERYVSAIDFIPGNAEIVHHATVLVDSQRTSLERVGPDGSFECMNDITRGELTQILNWAPGMLPIELPSDVGVKIAPNPLFILLVHYSPKGSTIAHDRSRVQIRYATTRPSYVLEMTILGGIYGPLPDGMGLQPSPADNGAPELRIPVGAKNHVERMLAPLPHPGDPAMAWLGNARVFNIMGHAHLAATNVSGLLRKRDGSSECLLNDRWNFHWQRRYTYESEIDQLPLLEDGDVVDVSCTYDNSMDNSVLADELARRREPLRELVYGPSTRDEMCHLMVQVVRPNE